jgi:CheY-like chemotaxis protein
MNGPLRLTKVGFSVNQCLQMPSEDEKPDLSQRSFRIKLVPSALTSTSTPEMADSTQEMEHNPKQTATSGSVLVVDDNEQHLQIYCWMLQRRGYKCLPALVRSTSVNLPEPASVCLALLDYRLNSSLTAADVAARLQTQYPSAPIVVLSELPWMPDDAKPYAKAFVHKGEHDQLFETVKKFCAANAC